MVAMSKEGFEALERMNTALQIYRILVDVCGARESEQDRFIYYFTVPRLSYEWRFGGDLGSGGKFYDNGDKWYVGCYPEDDTPERKEIITKANALLKELKVARAQR
jgi:hypothetical protein